MFKSLLVICFMAATVTASLAQDVIKKKNGEGVQAKVLEITSTEIKYKRFDHQEGPTYTLAKAEVLMVKYENNSEEFFTGTDSYVRSEDGSKATVETTPVTANTAPAVPTATGQDSYLRGQIDAEVHYDDYRSAGTGVLITSLLSPLVGLVPAVVCSTTKPQEHNLNYPNYSLMQDAGYRSGYTNKARKIKSGRVWRNWGIAFGVNLVLAIALSQ